MDELGDGLIEDLGLEIGVEFLYYPELCEIFWRIKNLGSRILLVAGLSFSDCTLGLYTCTGDKITLSLQNSIAFIIKLNTPTHNHCKDFHNGSSCLLDVVNLKQRVTKTIKQWPQNLAKQYHTGSLVFNLKSSKNFKTKFEHQKEL